MAQATKWLRAIRGSALDGQPFGYKPDWITRALSRAGILSPEQAERAVLQSRVSINERVVQNPLALLAPGDEVRVDGALVSLVPPTLVLAFHKPAGFSVTTRDELGRPTVFDLLRAALSPDLARFGWHAVGRLDRDTTGLLLFTNDERVMRHVTLPETHLPKRYLASVHWKPSDEKLEPLRSGIELEDGLTRPAQARLRGANEVELILTEGRRRQVQRMLRAVGLPVRTLHREAVGGISLDVDEGRWRPLTDAEIEQGLGFRAG